MNRTTLARLAIALATTAGLWGCTVVSDVRGPDGESAHLVQCKFSTDCYATANELCPGGYVLRGGVTTNLLVSCKDDVPDRGPVILTSSPVPTREDARTCEAASKYAPTFGQYWAQHEPAAKGLPDAPTEADFVAVCRAMPENVQRCMHEKYRAAHDAACDAVLQRLDEPTRRKVDGLYLEAPAG